MSSNDRRFYVYALYRSDGRIFYVGKGTAGRHLSHFKKSTNSKVNNIFKNEAKKGKSPYYEIIADSLTHDEALELEHLIVSEVGRIDKGNGPLVNFTDGGEGVYGIIFSDDEIHRRSEYRRLNPVWKDGMPEEVRRKISKSLKGKMVGEKNSFYGKEHSPETKEKLRGPRKKMQLYNHTRIRTYPEIRRHWLDADKYYKFWKDNNKPKPHMLASLMGIKFANSLSGIVGAFTKGWVPCEDPEFLNFKETYKNEHRCQCSGESE